jgi:hypothetical protein
MITDRTDKYHIRDGKATEENLMKDIRSERNEKLYFFREQNCPCSEISP